MTAKHEIFHLKQELNKQISIRLALVEALRTSLRALTMDSDMEEDFAKEIKQAKQALEKAGE